MTAEANTRPYHLRLLGQFYDEVRFRFFDWPAGTVVSDQAQVEMIDEARDAPVEKIRSIEENYKCQTNIQ